MKSSYAIPTFTGPLHWLSSNPALKQNCCLYCSHWTSSYLYLAHLTYLVPTSQTAHANFQRQPLIASAQFQWRPDISCSRQNRWNSANQKEKTHFLHFVHVSATRALHHRFHIPFSTIQLVLGQWWWLGGRLAIPLHSTSRHNTAWERCQLCSCSWAYCLTKSLQKWEELNLSKSSFIKHAKIV